MAKRRSKKPVNLPQLSERENSRSLSSICVIYSWNSLLSKDAKWPASSPSTEEENATVELTDWNLRQKLYGKFYLQGIKRNDPLKRPWRSSTLQKRLDNRSFMTSSKATYRLVGNMNPQVALEDGWPFHLIEKFSKGIPYKWRHIIAQTFGRRFKGTCSPPKTVFTPRKVESNCPMTRSALVKRKADDTVANIMKKAAVALIQQNVSLLKHVCSTPIKKSPQETTEMPDDICNFSPVKDVLPQPVTKKRCRATEGNLGNTFHHRQRHAKRRKRLLAVPLDEDGHCSFDEVPSSNSPIEVLRPIAASKPPPAVLPMVKLTQKALSCMQNCRVVLRNIKSKNEALPALEKIVAEKKTLVKALKCTKSRPIRAGNKRQKLKPTAAENVEMACVEQDERPKLNKDVLKKYEAITAKPGTLKRKQQMREFLIEHNNHSEDADFLSKEVPNEGLNKMIGEFITNDDFSTVTDVSSASDGETSRRQNVIMTPVSERKSPPTSFSPTYHRNRNRQHIDKYVLQRNAEMKLKAKQPAPKRTVIKRNTKRQFMEIPMNNLKLLPLRMDSDEENLEVSSEEN